jgi:hypothetical protein
MRESGECYVFDDDRIWHMLTPVAVLEGNQYAYSLSSTGIRSLPVSRLSRSYRTVVLVEVPGTAPFYEMPVTRLAFWGSRSLAAGNPGNRQSLTCGCGVLKMKRPQSRRIF